MKLSRHWPSTRHLPVSVAAAPGTGGAMVSGRRSAGDAVVASGAPVEPWVNVKRRSIGGAGRAEKSASASWTRCRTASAAEPVSPVGVSPA